MMAWASRAFLCGVATDWRADGCRRALAVAVAKLQDLSQHSAATLGIVESLQPQPMHVSAFCQFGFSVGTFVSPFGFYGHGLSSHGECYMKKLVAGCLFAASAISGAYAATTMTAAPAESWTVTNYYKQAVYDPKESKIGDIDDVLLDKSGKITGLVVGVGGFLGAGEKDVIVPFTAVKNTKKNDKWWLTLDETKDDLKNAPGFKYDKASTTWVPDKK
jgi:sporulation protein YlmC with PRC-barrel domain